MTKPSSLSLLGAPLRATALGGALLIGGSVNYRSPGESVRRKGRHTFKRRWTKERNRSSEIGKIEIGDSVSRFWEGEWHEVTCADGFWIYKEREFATLYAVAAFIVGERDFPRADDVDKVRRMSNWSAVRFFKLR